MRADDLVVALDLEGILVSSGAACGSGKPEPSHVLLALGLTDDAARSTIRFSVRPDLSIETVDQICAGIVTCIRRMRAQDS